MIAGKEDPPHQAHAIDEQSHRFDLIDAAEVSAELRDDPGMQAALLERAHNGESKEEIQKNAAIAIQRAVAHVNLLPPEALDEIPHVPSVDRAYQDIAQRAAQEQIEKRKAEEDMKALFLLGKRKAPKEPPAEESVFSSMTLSLLGLSLARLLPEPMESELGGLTRPDVPVTEEALARKERENAEWQIPILSPFSKN